MLYFSPIIMNRLATLLVGILAVLVSRASVSIGGATRDSKPKDPFYAPPLGALASLSLEDAPRLNTRTQSGLVVACWQGDSLIIRTRAGEYLRARLHKSPAPHRGEHIELAGHTAADGERIMLADALWRPTQSLGIREEPAVSLSGSDLQTNARGDTRLRTDLFGRRLTLTGIVRNGSNGSRHRFYLEDAQHLIPVDFSGCPEVGNGLQPGSRIAVTGVCLIEDGIVLLPGDVGDLLVISRPSWWTPTRFWVLIGILAVLLVFILWWNRSLRRLTRRREQELQREQFANESNRLKVEERTRLAVELHDTLSQSLAGISLELAAAGASPHVDRAARALKSARAELRNCLWDLRSRTFDKTDMREAVLKTLVPVIDESRLRVRFSVPRESLSDNSAHALLCAIRELVGNALTHGKANVVRVAGTMEDGLVSCSVTDDGCGFDPATAPGPNDGHFGLQGVRERILRLGGNLTVESAPGHGAKMTFTLSAGSPKRPEKR